MEFGGVWRHLAIHGDCSIHSLFVGKRWKVHRGRSPNRSVFDIFSMCQNKMVAFLHQCIATGTLVPFLWPLQMFMIDTREERGRWSRNYHLLLYQRISFWGERQIEAKSCFPRQKVIFSVPKNTMVMREGTTYGWEVCHAPTPLLFVDHQGPVDKEFLETVLSVTGKQKKIKASGSLVDLTAYTMYASTCVFLGGRPVQSRENQASKKSWFYRTSIYFKITILTQLMGTRTNQPYHWFI